MEQDIIDKLKKAGRINVEALKLGKTLIKEGVKVIDVVLKVEALIKEKADLAFPVNLSFNQTAAHDTMDIDDKRIIKKDDVIKLDVGTHVDGYIADSAITIDVSGNNTQLLESAKEALNNAVKMVRPGVSIGDIGAKIQETIESYGFKPISNLSGHCLKRFNLHTGMSIPNVATNDSRVLNKGDVIAIEPFATNGNGHIHESGDGKIFMLEKKVPMRLPLAKKLLNKIDERFNGLPFSYHHLFDLGFDNSRIPFAFSILKKHNCFIEFPPLVEDGNGLVAQFEHTVIVDDEPIVTTKF